MALGVSFLGDLGDAAHQQIDIGARDHQVQRCTVGIPMDFRMRDVADVDLMTIPECR